MRFSTVTPATSERWLMTEAAQQVRKIVYFFRFWICLILFSFDSSYANQVFQLCRCAFLWFLTPKQNIAWSHGHRSVVRWHNLCVLNVRFVLPKANLRAWPLIWILRAPSHTQAKSRDLVIVRTLDSHPKAVPWVLGKLFYVVTGPQA